MTIKLTMSPAAEVAMRLDAVLGAITCPTRSPPCEDSFKMVVPVSPHEAGVVVLIKKVDAA